MTPIIGRVEWKTHWHSEVNKLQLIRIACGYRPESLISFKFK